MRDRTLPSTLVPVYSLIVLKAKHHSFYGPRKHVGGSRREERTELAGEMVRSYRIWCDERPDLCWSICWWGFDEGCCSELILSLALGVFSQPHPSPIMPQTVDSSYDTRHFEQTRKDTVSDCSHNKKGKNRRPSLTECLSFFFLSADF